MPVNANVRGAGVFLHNGRMVLLVHQRDSDLWGFPKGGIEQDEDDLICWKRELHEETGIEKLPFHRVEKMFNTLKYNITEVKLFTDNLPEIYPASDEVDQVEWIPLRQISQYRLNAVTRNVIRSYTPKDPFAHFRSCRYLGPTSDKSDKSDKGGKK